MDASRGSHPILLAQPVRKASDSVARSAVVQRSGTGYVKLKTRTLAPEAQPGARFDSGQSGVQEGGPSGRPSVHLDALAEGTGRDEYIHREAGKLRPLKQRQVRRPRLTGAGFASLRKICPRTLRTPHLGLTCSGSRVTPLAKLQ
jgi:hypothetical protein